MQKIVYLLFCCIAINSINVTVASAQNELRDASSLYLRNHGENPIEWKPWTPSVFEAAQEQHKLVIISIGYASCHWCQVMEEETFSDSVVADLMNGQFINIKIDKEERPDLARKYASLVQLMNKQSGWPLNAVLLPDGNLVFGGTYFDKSQWISSLKKVLFAYKHDRDGLIAYGRSLSEASKESYWEKKEVRSDAQGVKSSHIREALLAEVDWEKGGFQQPQKFLASPRLGALIDLAHGKEDKQAFQAVLNSLRLMQYKGIYDQVNGGFFRYSTNDDWNSPHFEKMLYDNAQMLLLYARAYKISPQPELQLVINEQYDFLTRELSDPQGGFSASMNAVSEGQEGGYYLIERSPFLERDYFRTVEIVPGKHLPVARQPIDHFAEKQGISFNKLLKERAKLRARIQMERIVSQKPQIDSKIIASWNALTIHAMLTAFEATGNKAMLDRALDCAEYTQRALVLDSVVSHTNGNACAKGLLEDHAQLARAYIHAYQITNDMLWLDRARELTTYAEHHLVDDDGLLCEIGPEGEFERRIYSYLENDMEAPAAVMAMNMATLGTLYGDKPMLDLAQKIARWTPGPWT